MQEKKTSDLGLMARGSLANRVCGRRFRPYLICDYHLSSSRGELG